MSALPVPLPEPADERSLGELKEIANREYADGLRAAASAVRHWMTSGDALIEAKSRVAGGEWHRWLETNFDGAVTTAHKCIRLATYKDYLSLDEMSSTTRALHFLRGLPRVDGYKSPTRAPEELRDEARRLFENGLDNKTEIARLLGVSQPAVKGWLDPAWELAKLRTRREKLAETRRVRDAVRRQRRDASMRKIGGAPDKAYCAIRKTMQEVERAESDTDSREVRAALKAAYSHLVKAEGEIVRAVGVS